MLAQLQQPENEPTASLGTQQDNGCDRHCHDEAAAVPSENPLCWLPIDVRNTAATIHLDAARAIAAIAVLVYHVRYRFFLDYANLPTSTLLAKVFYSLTAFGHDAVMVFFVLSGFLISSSVIRDCQLRQFSWRRYSSARLTRLYLVLIPGLVLTVLWDSLGLHFYGTNPIYTGTETGWIQDYFNVQQRLSPQIAIGNAFFLQTILVPTLGSNAPLWSLANEFWYYCLFPLICIGLLYAPTPFSRLASLGVLAVIMHFVGWRILAYFPIWLFGSLLCVVPQYERLSRPTAFRVAVVLSLVLFAASMLAGHVDSIRARLGNSEIAVDYLTALGFSILLFVLLHDKSRPTAGVYAVVAKLAAGFSYTLYVTHIPLLVFLHAALISGRPWQPTPFFVSMAINLSLICLAYAFVIARYTEARTAEVRAHLKARASSRGFV